MKNITIKIRRQDLGLPVVTTVEVPRNAMAIEVYEIVAQALKVDISTFRLFMQEENYGNGAIGTSGRPAPAKREWFIRGSIADWIFDHIKLEYPNTPTTFYISNPTQDEQLKRKAMWEPCARDENWELTEEWWRGWPSAFDIIDPTRAQANERVIIQEITRQPSQTQQDHQACNIKVATAVIIALLVGIGTGIGIGYTI